jgi:hypothetical protein
MDSMFQTLDRMGASRQRGKYYDYLNELQKQKLGAAKAKDREDAHDQRDLNRETERLFEGQRNQLIDARISLENPDTKDGYLDRLDRAIGFAQPWLRQGATRDELQEILDKQIEENIEGEVYNPPWAPTHPDDTPSQRLAVYAEVIKEIKKDPNIVPGSAATQQLQRLTQLYNYSNAAVDLATSTETLLKKPNKNIKAFINEDGIMDYQFHPSRGQIKFFKNEYNEHPFKGTRIERGSADAADAASYGQDRAEAPSSLPGGPLIGQEGYVTDVGPSGQEQGAPPPLDSFEGVGGLLPRPGQEAISPPVDEQGRPIHLQAERENLERWQEDPRRDITSDEYITPIPSYASGPDVAPVEESRGFSPAALADAIDAVMAREERQPADLEAAIRRQAGGPLPAVEGNRPIRLDQLEGPVYGDATVTEEQARTPEYLQEGFRIPGNRGIANPYESVYQPWYDQKSDFEKAMHMDEQARMPQGDSPLMESIPPQDRDSQPGMLVPHRDPRFEAGMGFADTGTGQYVPPFDRGPLADRSYPEMGRVNDADYPTSLEGDIIELNTMNGPVMMRRLNSPLVNRSGRTPSMKEVLWEDYPEVREPLDYEPYPGNPLYLPGGPLYEEEE